MIDPGLDKSDCSHLTVFISICLVCDIISLCIGKTYNSEFTTGRKVIVDIKVFDDLWCDSYL